VIPFNALVSNNSAVPSTNNPCPETRKPRPEVRAGRGGVFGSVPVPPLGARPDQGVAAAVLVVEKVGVNRRVERRIVQLDREVVAALAGAFRPGGPNLGTADVNPMAGDIVVGSVGLGDNADVPLV
jgi:hypothetical protein